MFIKTAGWLLYPHVPFMSCSCSFRSFVRHRSSHAFVRAFLPSIHACMHSCDRSFALSVFLSFMPACIH